MTTIIIPAHNEQTVIARCLESVLTGLPRDDFRIIVVCNGCSDATADVARAVQSPLVTVLEISVASKIAALNAGDEAAGADFPRIYIDADVVMAPDAIVKLAEHLDVPAAAASAPHLRIKTDGRPWLIRQYMNAYLASPWVREDLVGSGVYGVSEAGWHRIHPFPEILNDDKWVFDNFLREERRSVESWFQIEAPRTVRALVAAKARVTAGERELHNLRAAGALTQPVYRPQPGGTVNTQRILLAKPVAVLAWRFVRLLIRLQDARNRRAGREKSWAADSTTRVSA